MLLMRCALAVARGAQMAQREALEPSIRFAVYFSPQRGTQPLDFYERPEQRLAITRSTHSIACNWQKRNGFAVAADRFPRRAVHYLPRRVPGGARQTTPTDCESTWHDSVWIG